MPETTNPNHCGRCGAELSGFAPDGLCAGCLLESALAEKPATADDRAKGRPLLVFDDYALLEEIARGGMGVVYRARQLSLNRAVAVKMMLSGHLADPAEVKRFRVEAETAAQLRHPNIVAIHEVGEYAGQPFFSMDLVEGRNLAQCVRDEALPARKAASYLQVIAQAVQYAHSHGILHRDLKPSNILIDEYDQPRITDFGLAKRLADSQVSPAVSQLTLTGQVLGSPSFIPPEQAAGHKGDLGPTGDVYSLGAILYHCVTGRPPFVADTLTATLRMVAEQEPVSPRLLNAGVPRDLETICLKCLEKDPARRYATAQELAEDLERFLRHEPIRARRVSAAGRLHRWCHRNRALAGTGAAVLALLLVVAIGSPIAIFRINRERRHAEANLAKAQETAKFLADMFEGAGPSVARGQDVTVLKNILNKAADRVGKVLTNQPEVEADLRLIIGKTYEDLGEYTNALAMTREALRLRKALFGAKHLLVAEGLNNQGVILSDMGRQDEAVTCDREALAIKRQLLGAENLDVALSMCNLGFRLWNQSDFAGAEEMQRESLRIRRKVLPMDHPDIGKSLNNLAMVLWARGDFGPAEAYFREALDIFRKAFGNNHPFVATMLNNVSTVLRDLGRLEESEAMAREALAMRQKLLGERHVLALYSQDNLAIVLQRQGKLDEAVALHRAALAQYPQVVGTNHQYVAEALSDLAIILARQGDLKAGEAMQRDALATAQRASIGKENPDAADALDRLGTLLAARGEISEAAGLLTNALTMTRNLVGTNNPDAIPALRHLSWVMLQQGDSSSAESLRREATALSLKGGDYGIRALTSSCYDLADLLQTQGKFAQAEPLLLEASVFLQSRPEVNQSLHCAVRQRLANFYEAWNQAFPNAGKASEATAWKRKMVEL